MENNKKNIAQIVAATISIMVVIGVIVLIVTQVGKIVTLQIRKQRII